MKYNARTRGARGECHTPVLYNGPSWNRSSFDYFFISPLSIQYLYAQLIFFKRQEKEKKQSSLRGRKKTVPRVVTLPFRKICESNGGGKNCDLDASNFRSKSRFVSSWAKLRWKIKRKRLSETEIDVFRRVKRIFLLFSILLFRSVGWFSVKLNHVLETSLSVEL